MARRSILSEEEETEINLSPMIDCIFILLIFFIVTTVFVEEQGIQVNKPDAAASASPDESDAITLEITAENKIRYEDDEIDLAEVTGIVKSRGQDAETPVTIKAHESSAHQLFVSVWDAAKRGGAEALSFTTTN